jgi:hypothetical protein
MPRPHTPEFRRYPSIDLPPAFPINREPIAAHHHVNV